MRISEISVGQKYHNGLEGKKRKVRLVIAQNPIDVRYREADVERVTDRRTFAKWAKGIVRQGI